jgi:SAM-dependent methyltransferase
MHSQRDQADFEFLEANAKIGRDLRLTHFTHLDQPLGIWSYIRIANDIAAQVPTGKVLDWGCGYGQMTYLLGARGLEVTPFDVGAAEGAALPAIPLCAGLQVVRTEDPTHLPFASGSFDCVLSCGVLEHVEEDDRQGSERGSLREIARVLRPGGALLIYQLPQKHAWQEALARRLKRAYYHSRLYTAREIRGMLSEAGFSVRRLRRANLFPKNLSGMPDWVRHLYGRCGRGVLAADRVLCGIPVLRSLAGVMEVTAGLQSPDSRLASESAPQQV